MSESPSPAPPANRELGVDTPAGTAQIELFCGSDPVALMVLGHSAGGDVHAPLLVAVQEALARRSFATALVEQPYRVAGRRLPDPAPRLDAAMLAVVAAVQAQVPGLPLLLGGKSSGARVACRTAKEAGAVAVVALGFPLVPSGRPGRSRAAELDAGCPVLVVQGERDHFGTPDDIRTAAGTLPVTVHAVARADHAFAARRIDGRTTADCLDEAVRAVTDWVLALL